MGITEHLSLLDHHCHGLLRGDPTPDEFRLLGTESDHLAPDGLETLDSPFGLAVRKICAPLLDLPAHVSIAHYLDRRAELGAAEVDRRLMSASGTGRVLIDTGSRMVQLSGPQELTAAVGIPAHEIVRLETVAETLAPGVGAEAFPEALTAALTDAAAQAVGWKSIIAYRYGLDLEAQPPSRADVVAAAGRWMSEAERSGSHRIADPVLLQFLIWAAIPFGKPIQFHVGYGDSDVELYRADPSRATRFFAATIDSGARFTLLHNYPFVRESAILSQVFPHVYCDVGLATGYLGPSGDTVVRQVLEIAPFHKVLYSSDAHALSEHYLVSARGWRHGMDRLLDEWIAGDWVTATEAERIAGDIAAGTGRRVYRLDPAP